MKRTKSFWIISLVLLMVLITRVGVLFADEPESMTATVLLEMPRVVSEETEVKTSEPSPKIKVKVAIYDDLAKTAVGTDAYQKASETGVVLAPYEVTVPKGSTAAKAIIAADQANDDLTILGAEENYISSINGLAASDGEGISGWMCLVNDWFINEGVGSVIVKEGDIISLHYTITGSDLGGSWNNNDTTLKDLNFSVGELSPTFTKNTTEYTLSVPKGTTEVNVNKTASNKNFQIRTYLDTYDPTKEGYKIGEDISIEDGSVIYIGVGESSWPSMNNGIATKYTITVVEERDIPAPSKKPIKLTIESIKDFINSKDAKLELNAKNQGEEEINPYLIVGLYNKAINDVIEMVSYNYINPEIKSNESITWDSAFNVPEEGNYFLKAFAWNSIPENLGDSHEIAMDKDSNQEQPITSSEIPEDFTNDLWLNADFMRLSVDEEYQITARRVEEIIDNAISNSVNHPTYHYNVVEGNSVSVDEAGKITALKEGISLIKVTYDATTANSKEYGACSVVNEAYMAVEVNNNPADVEISTDITKTTFDTIYYTDGDTTPFEFTVEAEGSDSVEVNCNGHKLALEDEVYTANLENRSNVIGITATKGEQTKSQYYVVDARKVEITIINTTNPDQPIKVGDSVEVSFKGITMPIYKLATIYNPCFGDGSWGNYASAVCYTNSDGEKVFGRCGQYDLATKNTIKLTFDKAGDYEFTDGCIEANWWGYEAGNHRNKTAPGSANLDASAKQAVFSTLPSFVINVKESENSTENLLTIVENILDNQPSENEINSNGEIAENKNNPKSVEE